MPTAGNPRWVTAIDYFFHEIDIEIEIRWNMTGLSRKVRDTATARKSPQSLGQRTMNEPLSMLPLKLFYSVSIHFSEIFDRPWKDARQISASHPIHIAHVDDLVVEVFALDLDYSADWNHSGHSFVQIGVLVSD